MTNIIEVENRIITLRGQQVIIDADVAELYGIETKRVNEAVANNPEKFPEGYILAMSETEKQELVENFDRFNRQKHSTSIPKAFTEEGLYMLATILKSPKAVETTIAIVEAYAKLNVIKFIASAPTPYLFIKRVFQEALHVLMHSLRQICHTTFVAHHRVYIALFGRDHPTLLRMRTLMHLSHSSEHLPVMSRQGI
ncbi:MAG: ORF6N domain-containing protein [Bacteroidales bacterium]|nr:ORF6N domain-containing protein [Bacteroidales bacterium]